MHVRVISQRTKKGKVRKYSQLVEAFRRPDGMPATRVIAHLGSYDPILVNNLTLALKAAKKGECWEDRAPYRSSASVSCQANLAYLSIAVIITTLRRFGISNIIEKLAPSGNRIIPLHTVVEALIANRCLAPSSKLAFQEWLPSTCISEWMTITNRSLNNTRVHRALDELANIDQDIQHAITQKIIDMKVPRIIYIDLTDVWFEAGGGSLSRRGQTKQGHRSKRKINLALLVNEAGLPMRWEILQGALNETTILPRWVDALSNQTILRSSVLIFDRGMPSVENFNLLTLPQSGHLFLTCVKSDSIPTYVELDNSALDHLQTLSDSVEKEALVTACNRLHLTHFKEETYAKDLGIVTPPKPKSPRQKRPPMMHMYLYFNREIQLTKRQNRREKIRQVYRQVSELNIELKQAKRQRDKSSIERKAYRLLEKLSLSELIDVTIAPMILQGRSKEIQSFQVKFTIKKAVYRYMKRYDGLTLLVSHPDLAMSVAEAIMAYRQKDVIEANFKTMKSVLNIRPVFHWTDRKIKSHITICILGLLVERLIENNLKSQKDESKEYPLTTDRLLEELSAINLNRIRYNSRTYLIRTEESERIRDLINRLDMQILLDMYPISIKID